MNKKKIKVAMILYKTDLTGGPGHILLNNIEAGNKEEFEYVFLAYKPGTLTQILESKGYKINFINMPVISKYFPIPYLYSILKAFLYFKLNKIKIAHFYFDRYRDSILLASKLANIKSVMHIHGHPRSYKTFWVSLADYFVYNSQFTKNSANYPLSENQHSVVYYGFDPSYFKDNVDKIANEKTLITVISRIHPAKKIELAINCFEIIREKIDAKLIIAGDIQVDEYYEKLKNIIEEKNLNNDIEFIGHIDNISEVYRKGDLLLHTAENEAFGYVFLEAAYFKIPVLAFKSGGIPEVVLDQQSGLLAEYCNVNELANLAIELLKDKEKINKITEFAFKRLAKDFTISGHQKNIESIYKKLIKL